MVSRRLSAVELDDPIVPRVKQRAQPVPHLVQYCRWAESGFPVAWPVWLDSAGFEWACRRGPLKALPDPRVCLTCARWEAAPRRD